MQTILVTGGAGYIGAQTCKAVAAGGFLPVVYDSLVNGHREAVRWGPFEHGDLLDRARLDEAFVRHRPAAVIHFAGHAYVGESVEDPCKYYRNNFCGSLTLLEAMRDHGIGQLIFSSSCATYGIPAVVPVVETAPQVPVSPYGFSKLAVERMIADFGAAHAIRSVSLRYFNAAGADPDGETGEDHEPETRIFPLAIFAAFDEARPLTVFGDDFDTPDGTCIRDYVHVADLADAHVKALAALRDGHPSSVYNIGSGEGASVLQVIGAVEAAAGRPVRHVIGPRRAGDPPVLVADPAKARDGLGWTPRHSGLDEIARTALAWHRARGALPAADQKE